MDYLLLTDWLNIGKGISTDISPNNSLHLVSIYFGGAMRKRNLCPHLWFGLTSFFSVATKQLDHSQS